MTLENKIFSIWLIGPSGSGKKTIGKLLYKKIKSNKNIVMINGDQMRSLYENNLGYDKISRSKNTWRYINLVNWLMSFNISSIVSVISPFEEDRQSCRSKIEHYFEIYLKCSRDERIKRDTKKLYVPAINGKKKNVVDVDIPFDKPINCDMQIDTENKSAEESVQEILKKIKF